jgi:hypothetical protein
MLHNATPAGEKRAAFRAGLTSGKLLRCPGAFNPLSAMLIERHGFDGLHLRRRDLRRPGTARRRADHADRGRGAPLLPRSRLP